MAAGVVLTASHVVRDDVCAVSAPLQDPAGGWLDGRVIERDEAQDLAVVAVPGLPDETTRVRFGRLPASGDPVDWVAAGFPAASAGGRVRDVEELRGTCPLIAGSGSGRLALTVITRAAVTASGRSGWAGLSGAPVLVRGLVVGVVTAVPVDYERGLTAQRLTAASDRVLAALRLDSFESVREDHSEVIRRHRDRLVARFDSLDLSAIPDHELSDVKLDDLYIQLEALPEASDSDSAGGRGGGPDRIAEVRTLGEQAWSRVHERFRSVEDRLVLRRPQEVVDDALARGRSVVVLGVPGAGKSTMLRALVRDLARKGDDSPVPLFGRLADVGRRADRSVLELVLRDATENLIDEERDHLRAALQRAVQEKRACFLLDSLDEAGEKAIEEIRQSLQRLASDGNCLIVTSRPIGYENLNGFDAYRIQPMLPGDSAEFVNRWFQVLADKKNVAKEQRQEWIGGRSLWLQDQLAERPQLRDLAANPLLLTFLAVLAGDNAAERLPEHRWMLYRAYESRLFAAWENRRDGRKATLENLSRTIAVRGLHEIARFLHEIYYATRESRTEPARLPVREAIIEAVALRLEGRSTGRPGLHAEREAEAVVDFWEQSGMIRGAASVNGDGWFLFAHQTFQEYGTARALARAFADDMPGLRRYLEERLDVEGWSEVVPLTLACLAAHQQDVTALLAQLCRDGDTAHTDRALVHAARSVAEGAIVGETLLADLLERLDRLSATSNATRAYQTVYDAMPNDEAVHLLIGIGWNHPTQVRPLLTGMLAPENPPGRQIRAAEALGRLGDRPYASKVLHRLASDRQMHSHWRLVAAWSLSRLGSAAEAVALIRRLLPFYHSGDGRRSTLVDAVAEIRTPDAIRLLTEVAAAPRLDPEERIGAAVMLHRLGHRQAACRVLANLRRDRGLPIHTQVEVKRTLDQLCARRPT